jgi:WD40 repeat protein
MSLNKQWKLLLAPGAVAAVCLTLLFFFPRGLGPRADRVQTLTLEGHRLPVQALAFATDGATLTAAGYLSRDPRGWEVTVWDVRTGQPSIPRAEHAGAVRSLALAHGGRSLAVAGQDHSLWLWETGATKGRRLAEHHCNVEALSLTGDGGRLVGADAANVVYLWNVAGGLPKVCGQGEAALVRTLAFSPDGTALAGGGWDKSVRLWDAITGEERGVLRGHASAVVAVAFAPDGRLLACGDLHGVVRIWEVVTRSELAVLETITDKVFLNEVTALSFAPDGRTLALAVDRSVQLWDVHSGRRLARLEGHEGKVICLAFAPDGTRLASGGYDRTVRIWPVGECLPTPP